LIASKYWRVAGVVVAVALLPASARAQPVARSFEELQRALKVGQTVVVTDESGGKAKGLVEELTALSLTIGTRKFTEGRVTEIRMADSLWSGVLIGAAIGAGLAAWDYAIDPSEPGNAAISAVAISAGAAIGAGIDALNSGKLLYASPRRAVGMSLLVTGKHKGVAVSLRF
jgi:hypothetical protein